MKEDLLAKKIAKRLRGEVEVDETYINAGDKGEKKLDRPPRRRGGTGKRGRGGLKEGKIPVIAVTERGGRTMLFMATEGLSKELILDILEGWLRRAQRYTRTTSRSTQER